MRFFSNFSIFAIFRIRELWEALRDEIDVKSVKKLKQKIKPKIY